MRNSTTPKLRLLPELRQPGCDGSQDFPVEPELELAALVSAWALEPACSLKYPRYNFRFCVRMILHILPSLARQAPLGASVEFAVSLIHPQPVSKQQSSLNLLRPFCEDVQVDVDVRTLEEAMLVPVWLPDGETVTCPLERGHVGRLVGGVSHHE